MKIHRTADGPSNASSLSVKVPGGTKKTTPPPAAQLQRRTRYQQSAGESRSSTTSSNQRRRSSSNIGGRSSSQRSADEKTKNSSSQKRSFSSTSRGRGQDVDPFTKQLVDEGFPVYQWLLILSFIGFAWYQLARPKRQQQQGKSQSSKRKILNGVGINTNTNITASPRRGRKGSKTHLNQSRSDPYQNVVPLSVPEEPAAAAVKEDKAAVLSMVEASSSSAELKKKTRKKRAGKKESNTPLSFDADSPDSVSTDGSASSVEQAKEWTDARKHTQLPGNVPKEEPRDGDSDQEVLDAGVWTTVEVKTKFRLPSAAARLGTRSATVKDEQTMSGEFSLVNNVNNTGSMSSPEEPTTKGECAVDTDETLAKLLQEEEERAAVSLGEEKLFTDFHPGSVWEEVPMKKKKNKRKDL